MASHQKSVSLFYLITSINFNKTLILGSSEFAKIEAFHWSDHGLAAVETPD